MTQELKTYNESWLIKAGNDLVSAQRLQEIEPMILDNSCFHCQQAIEKLLNGSPSKPKQLIKIEMPTQVVKRYESPMVVLMLKAKRP